MKKKYKIIFSGIITILFILLLINSSKEWQAIPAPFGNLNFMKENQKHEVNSVKSTSNTQVNISNKTFDEIPDSEILSGGPGKDGIPSIENPKFVSAQKASFLNNNDMGTGLRVGDETRFYPFQILVWHEIVNDTVAGIPLAITYCPLCLTGITYDRRIDEKVVEFGVSGMLWKSNLVMYDRTENSNDESLWSQVLGRAIKGPKTGTKLIIYPSDTVKFGEWKKTYPNTKVLSKDTGTFRAYGTDPYGDYYTNRDVSFGATFNDTRLHPKEFILGIEIEGQFKAYVSDTLPVGATTDTFAGRKITINKSKSGEVRIVSGSEEVPHIGSFWFAWLAVHSKTELYEDK